jgi:hypothetical protein
MRMTGPGSALVVRIIAAASLVASTMVAAPSRADAGCLTAWSIVTSQNAGRDRMLGRVDARTSSDAWAVGSYGAADFGVRHTLIERWDGSSFEIVPSPDSSRPVNLLTGISTLSSQQAWAVGFSRTGDFASEHLSKTLIERWNGSTWAVVRSPNPDPDFGTGYAVNNELFGVHAISSSDAWAVGETMDQYSTFSQALALHWDGERWRNARIPTPGRYSTLYDVAASGPDDVWAVGVYDVEGLQRNLILHYDGVRWRRLPSVNTGPYLNYLLDVSVAGPDEAWAVGYHLAVFGFSQVYQTSAIHWDGTSWEVVDAPDVTQFNNYLRGVVSVAPGDAWAVGFWDTGAELRTLIEHWDGTDWSIVESPNRSQYINELYGIDTAGGRLLAVGQSSTDTGFRTLAMKGECV